MIIFRSAINDLFKTSLFLWLFLVLLEFWRPGTVHRFINLEYYFYLLLIFSLLIKFFNTAKS